MQVAPSRLVSTWCALPCPLIPPFFFVGIMSVLAAQLDSEGSQHRQRERELAAAAEAAEKRRLVMDEVQVHVVDLTSPPRSGTTARGSSQASQKSRKGRARRRTRSLSELMKEGYVKVGDELSFLGSTGVAVRDGWVEMEHQTVPLDAFVMDVVQQSSAYTAQEKDELRDMGQRTYELVRINNGDTLWVVSERALGAATTLRTEPDRFVLPSPVKRRAAASPSRPPAPAETFQAPPPPPPPPPEQSMRLERPVSPSFQVEADSMPLSLAEDSDCVNNNAPPPVQLQGGISTQLPELFGGSQDVPIEVEELDAIVVAPKSKKKSLGAVSEKESTSKRIKKEKTPPPPAPRREIILLDDSSSPQQTRVAKKRSRKEPAVAAPVTPEIAREIEEERRELEANKKFLERESLKKKNKTEKEQPKPPVAAFEAPKKAVVEVEKVDEAMIPVKDKVGASLVKAPVVLGSNLTSQMIAETNSALRELGGMLVNDFWNDEVTHVLVKVTGDGKCARTIKYLMAVLTGTAVVSHAWVRASRDRGFWVSEEPFFACDDRLGNGRNVVRVSLQRYRAGSAPLFNDMRFALHGAFEKPPTRNDLRGVIEAGGGVVVDLIPTRDSGEEMPIVICEPTIERDVSDDIYQRTGRDPLFFSWLLDCVSDLQLLPTRHNASYKKTFNEEAAAMPYATQLSPAL